jgi:MYXO-CTERM domain-containing protein
MHPLHPRTPLAFSCLLALAAPLLAPAHAEACGGTFCDNSATPMPVDQTGEDILFVQDGPEIEVHIRIQYAGEAERFAWLVPIQAVPEVSVGSEALFTRLSAGTAPRWFRTRTYECHEEDEDDWGTSGGLFLPSGGDLASITEPEIVFEDTVGAFEVVVLQGGSAAEVIDFLTQNGYAQDPAAEPILQEYLDEGFLFAAVKLTAGVEADAIHPLVFRFPGDEPCVPIRLTRIAAQQDMGIRAYFLGQERWAPLNYEHVVLNPLAYPWAENPFGAAGPYIELLTLAVDAAGGRAFATEYAGSSGRVSSFGVYRSGWDETAFIGLDMVQAIAEIADQGLNDHAQIQALLLEYMPPPEGIAARVFWNNVGDYADLVDIHDWDSAGFATAVSERIIEPGFHAVELLETWPMLTRLHTTMSPHEMIVDPMFQPAPMLGEVDNVREAIALDLCGDTAGERYTIPFGSPSSLPVCIAEHSNEWPAALRLYPALRIEKVPGMGPPQVIQDFTAEILADHAAWQASTCVADDGSGDGDDGGADGGPGDGAAGETGGSANDNNLLNRTSCACSSAAGESASGTGLGLLGLGLIVGVGLRGRRRRELT